MSYQRGYKYALRLSGAQRKHFAREFGASRFVFNTLLARNTEEYKSFKDGNGEKPVTSQYSLYNKLIGLKYEFPFLQENSVYTLRSGTANLADALKGFLSGKSRYPKFKSRRHKQSVTYHRTEKSYEFRLIPVTVKGVEVLYLKVPKLKEPIKVLWNRPLPSTPTQVTISRDTAGNFYASFLCERDGILTNGDGIVGIDLGLKDIVISSDGTVLPASRFLRKSARRLAIAQRKLAKKKRELLLPEWKAGVFAADHPIGAFAVSSGIKKLLEHHWLTSAWNNDQIALQGELCGPGIRRNEEGLKYVTFFVYGVYTLDDDGGYRELTPYQRTKLLKELLKDNMASSVIKPIPVFAERMILPSLEDMLSIADGANFNGLGRREGLVFKSHDNTLSLKVISNEYLLKNPEE